MAPTSKATKKSSTSTPVRSTNSDFKKRPKAKVGKRAPKQLNVTDTSFHATSIKVKNQTSSIIGGGNVENSNNNNYNNKNDNKNTNTLSSPLSSLLLISSRGKTIRELTIQLQHPASTVRISAAKGIKDIIINVNNNNNHSSIEIIRQNLYILLPTCGKCLLDDEKDVRDIGGIICLREIIQKLLVESSPSSSNMNNNNTSIISTNRRRIIVCQQIQSFGPLLIAYISAALNSLNKSIRYTGAQAVYILSSTVCEMMIPYIPNLLPPFIRLLSERSTTTTSTTNNNNDTTKSKGSTMNDDNNIGSMKKSKKRKRKHIHQQENISSSTNNNSDTPSLLINNKVKKRIIGTSSTTTATVVDTTLLNNLKALSALLQTIPIKESKNNINNHEFNTNINTISSIERQYQLEQPDKIFTIGGTSCNGLLLYQDPVNAMQQSQRIFRSWNDFSSSIAVQLVVQEDADKHDNNTVTTYSNDTNSLLDSVTKYQSPTEKIVETKTIYDLLYRVRDVLVEVSHRCNNTTTSCNNDGLALLLLSSSSPQHQHDFDLLVPVSQILRYFLQVYSKHISGMMIRSLSNNNNNNNNNDSYEGNNNKLISSTRANKEQNKMEKLLFQLANLILECFPISIVNNNNNNNNTLVDETNANMCIALQCIATLTSHSSTNSSANNKNNNHNVNDDNSNSNNWVETIGAYVQQTLENDDEQEEEEEVNEGGIQNIGNNNEMINNKRIARDGNSTIAATQKIGLLSTSKSLLQVFEHLLLTKKDDRLGDLLVLERKNKIRTSMIDTFCSVFFNTKRNRNSSAVAVARSSVARYAVRVAISMFHQCDYNLEEAVATYGVEIVDFLKVLLVQYLVAWKGDYLNESAAAIEYLLNMIRRITPTTNGTTNNKLHDNDIDTIKCMLLDTLRIGIEKLLVANDDKETTKSNSILDDSSSTFEVLPFVLQRQIICCITLMEYPTVSVLHHLGRICARSRMKRAGYEIDNDNSPAKIIADPEASYIVQTIHTIRKTIPMQKYFGFLMDSTGLMHIDSCSSGKQLLTGQNLDTASDFIDSIDKGIRDITACLIECGSWKVLPKLENLFIMLLKRSIESETKFVISSNDTLGSRAVLAMLALFSLDITEANISIFDCTSENFRTVVISSTVGVLLKLVQMSDAKSNFSLSSKWTRPIKCLLCLRNSLLSNVVDALTTKLNKIEASGTVLSHSNILELLLVIARDKELMALLLESGQSSEKIILEFKRLNIKFKDGPLESLCGQILSHLQLILEGAM